MPIAAILDHLFSAIGRSDTSKRPSTSVGPSARSQREALIQMIDLATGPASRMVRAASQNLLDGRSWAPQNSRGSGFLDVGMSGHTAQGVNTVLANQSGASTCANLHLERKIITPFDAYRYRQLCRVSVRTLRTQTFKRGGAQEPYGKQNCESKRSLGRQLLSKSDVGDKRCAVHFWPELSSWRSSKPRVSADRHKLISGALERGQRL
jgi:hypothetical protein